MILLNSEKQCIYMYKGGGGGWWWRRWRRRRRRRKFLWAVIKNHTLSWMGAVVVMIVNEMMMM
jgi:hypothetical protein